MFVRLAFAAVAVSALAVCQAAPGSTTKATKCSPVKAGGHTYTVSATSVQCAFARKWVGKLAAKRLGVHTSSVSLKGGPTGYTCRAGTKGRGVAMPDVAGNVQTAGNCAKGPGGLGSFGGGPYFNWVVKSAY